MHRRTHPHLTLSPFAAQKALKLSGISFTILRPVTFIEVWDRVHPVCNGRVAGMVPGDIELQMLSTKDLGGAAAMSLINRGKHNGEIIDLAGDGFAYTMSQKEDDLKMPDLEMRRKR
jgi:uncharacterized protein YbjT (DUF2867 family)